MLGYVGKRVFTTEPAVSPGTEVAAEVTKDHEKGGVGVVIVVFPLEGVAGQGRRVIPRAAGKALAGGFTEPVACAGGGDGAFDAALEALGGGGDGVGGG